MKNYKMILEENRAWAEDIFKKIDKKMTAMAIRSRDKVVDGVDENGVHIDMMKTNPNWWCNGFWGGLNFMLYAHTKNEEYLKTARRNEELMDRALANYEKLDHDLGFMWHLLSGADYRITGDTTAKSRNFYAATTLASRFVGEASFIRAWNWESAKDYSIIDCLMNLPLLYWATEETGDDRFKRIAMAHADMSICDHLREDGSVVHIVEHDRESATVRTTHAGQGCAVGSSWSRGQA